jgi:hypothetical protein
MWTILVFTWEFSVVLHMDLPKSHSHPVSILQHGEWIQELVQEYKEQDSESED